MIQFHGFAFICPIFQTLLNTLSLPHYCFPARTLHDHVDMAVCLGPLFTFTDRCVCFYVSTILCGLLFLCHVF